VSGHLRLRPSSKHECNRHIRKHHAHHGAVGGGKVFIAALDGDRLCAVVVAENPKARMLQDGYTFELTRVCTDRTPHAASMLIAAATRAAFAMGVTRCVSYVLTHELGISYLAAGWHLVSDETGEPIPMGGGRVASRDAAAARADGGSARPPGEVARGAEVPMGTAGARAAAARSEAGCMTGST
jgi:hypothetical protein